MLLYRSRYREGKRLKNWKKKTLKKSKKNVDKAKMTMYNNRALTRKRKRSESTLKIKQCKKKSKNQAKYFKVHNKTEKRNVRAKLLRLN